MEAYKAICIILTVAVVLPMGAFIIGLLEGLLK
jgi:hypothetical protein